MYKVFLDANVLFAASYSQVGGSAEIIKRAKENKLILYSSRLAVKEAERNLRRKAGESQLDRFYGLVEEAKLILTESNKKRAKNQFKNLVGEKDAPILASAVKSKAKFLITLDRRHLLTLKVQKAELSIKIITPGQFIQDYL